MKSSKNRRQFLKNTSLAALSLGVISNPCEAKAAGTTDEKPLLTCDKTTLDYYGAGPFYTESPPMIEDHQLAAADEAGTRMIISGRIFNLDCSAFIPETVVDVWQANDGGQYDNDEYNLRGFTESNAQGFYMFETVMPGKYLNGNDFRPSHIHFKIKPPGFELLTTQLYFEGDTSIPSDAAASITSGTYDATNRIIPLTTNADGKLEGTWDIVINGEGIMTGTSDIHLEKGIVYKVSPNPFSDKVTIKYGVFKTSKVSLLVYDMQGREVANLEEKTLAAEKYEAVWTPEDSLPNGHYFVALKINDLQVHYLKIVRQR
ncbi:MAG: protocatechuate 3,4-dioxygenase beta subunit [Paraglaciecola sp.]|jgi:protocatechuate 3,4-dioxygenase beta subunit